ncbi:MAG TPA: DegT/DnrJ/EryC1/StrS family aminotransferase [Solirubrobacteraceae bacterium]|nr:DegT/DnrJ/EryC1/StrS family aminotransferase [Solirubrobacteraceae bacterium]
MSAVAAQRFTLSAKARRHAQLLADVARLSCWFATHGRTSISDGSGIVACFEREFAAATDSSFALAMTSGTAALHSAYFAVGVGPGSEVLLPAYTWHATATPVLQCGAVPVFCDVDPLTLTIDVEDLERRITPRTRAVCAVHIWGSSAEMDRIVEVARRHNLAVIEDCSHAHGARYRGKPVGSWGDIGCFSLHASKTVAAGEAGVAVTSDPALFDRMLLLGHPGRLAGGQAAGTFAPEVTDLGVKYRPHAFAVHLGRSSLRRLGQENERRGRVWARICGELESSRHLAPLGKLDAADWGGFYNYVVDFVSAREGSCAEDVVSLARSRGVPVGLEAYGQNLLHRAPVFTTLDRAGLGGGCFDPTRPWDENVADVRLPVCERIGPRLIAFDRMMYLASDAFARRSARELARAASEVASDARCAHGVS